jgi:hypothetical protein
LEDAFFPAAELADLCRIGFSSLFVFVGVFRGPVSKPAITSTAKPHDVRKAKPRNTRIHAKQKAFEKTAASRNVNRTQES